jgi:hypothetical protein
MARVVHKYEVAAASDFGPVSMPVDAQILHTDVQGHQVFVWALVSADAEMVERRLGFWGTGHEVPDGARYLGTGITDFALVWHVFEQFPLRDGRGSGAGDPEHGSGFPNTGSACEPSGAASTPINPIPRDYWREVPCGHPPDPVAMFGAHGEPVCHCGCILDGEATSPEVVPEAPGPIVYCQSCGCHVAVPPAPASAAGPPSTGDITSLTALSVFGFDYWDEPGAGGA